MDFEGWDKDAYCHRLQQLRRLLGMTQTEFAKHVGIAYKKWHHYEQGYPISRESAWILHKTVPGFSTDWLWHGDTRALSQSWIIRLRELEKAPLEPKKKPAQKTVRTRRRLRVPHRLPRAG